MSQGTPNSAPTSAGPMHLSRWGDPARAGDLPDTARGLVELVFGIHPQPALDAEPPSSALPPPALAALRQAIGADRVLTDPDTRRSRTRGKSTPDLLQARAGDWRDAPDVVVRPAEVDDIRRVLAIAVEHRLAVVPFGGGTAVTGGLVAERDRFAGVVSLDLADLNRLLAVDEVSMTATFEPGVRGPDAEALLAAHGLRLGHYPQSFEWASIGGFAATRSSGQSSAGYGRFDAMVVALSAVTPTGDISWGVAPASAAGPDLRQLLLGSEGTLGVLTSITVRVRRAPTATHYEAWRWPTFAAGTAAMRTIAQGGILPTVLRLSDESESAINLADPAAIGADAASSDEGGGCLMILGYEGDPLAVQTRHRFVKQLLHTLPDARELGTEAGEAWAQGRFNAPYLRDSLLDVGVLVETLETAAFWSNVEPLYNGVKAALKAELGDSTLVLCHISHVYETGCSLYFTVATTLGDEPLPRWQRAKVAATEAMVRAGGTITHHHAVGRDHRPWLQAEIGDAGVRVLRAVKAELDPTGILNPGVLIPEEIQTSSRLG